MGSEIIKLSGKDGAPLAPPKDAGKRFIRIDLDLITRQETISGHIYDKNLAINMIAEALKMVNNMGTAPIQALPDNKNGEGHS